MKRKIFHVLFALVLVLGLSMVIAAPASAAAGIIVNPIAGLTTTEAGGTATFEVWLSEAPAVDVIIDLSSSDLTEGTVAPASITFTPVNFATHQTVTITGVDDDVDDGNIVYHIITAPAISGDSNYNEKNAADVTVTNTDDDTAGITVGAISGPTTEAGGTATFTIVLDSEPTADVTIGLGSDDLTEGTVAGPTFADHVIFTAANWDTPQTVTLTGVDDFIADGPIGYNIVTATAVSTDPKYGDPASIDAADVGATNNDNETAGFTLSAISGDTTEAGDTATFTIVLNTLTTADVTIGLTSSDVTEGTVAPASVTFTAANWDTPQTVTVTGVNDDLDDGDQAYNIVTAAAVSADPGYTGLAVDDVAVTNNDDDVTGVTVSTISRHTTEAGGTATFTIVLNCEPTNDVTIPLASDNLLEGTITVVNVVFTAGNWDTPQPVTVTGVDDAIIDGDIAYNIVTGDVTSADGLYDALGAGNVANVAVINDDNEAGVAVGAISGHTSEDGTTATFTLELRTAPADDVVVTLTSDTLTEGTVAPATVTFTTLNWETPQTVTVTGVDDVIPVVDGDIAYNIRFAVTSADTDYNLFAAAPLAVVNDDNDEAHVTVSAISGRTSEDLGTATFTIVLDTQPTNDVTIPLASDNLLEGTITEANVVFTNANWDTPQTITVTGVDDALIDGDITYHITTGDVTSADVNYGALLDADVANVSVINDDNDTSGSDILDVVNNIHTVVDGINDILVNTTYGLQEIKTEVANIETTLDTGGSFRTFISDLFTSVDTLINSIKAKTDTINWADITSIGVKIDAIKAKTDTINWDDITGIKTQTDKLGDATIGLAAIKDAIDNISVGGGGGAMSAIGQDVTITRGSSVVILPIGTHASMGQLTIQSSGSGYNIEVWDGDSWLPIKAAGLTVDTITLSGLGFRIYNDLSSPISLDYVFVYNTAP